MDKKTDNHDPRAKLDLRRYFLRKYHTDEPPDVLDCCQGGGVLWSVLRSEFAVRTYWGVDVKPKKGRLKIDSARILQQPGWAQNVVDIDTYGSPWRHWAGVVANLSQPTTVFLTIGQWQMGVDKLLLTALGVNNLPIPPGIAIKLQGIGVSALLTRGCEHATIIEATEALSDGTARYIGLRIEPAAQTNGHEADTSGRSEHVEPCKEVQHV